MNVVIENFEDASLILESILSTMPNLKTYENIVAFLTRGRSSKKGNSKSAFLFFQLAEKFIDVSHEPYNKIQSVL